MDGLRGLPAMQACYCLGSAGHSGGPQDFLGTLLPLSLMQLLKLDRCAKFEPGSGLSIRFEIGGCHCAAPAAICNIVMDC